MLAEKAGTSDSAEEEYGYADEGWEHEVQLMCEKWDSEVVRSSWIYI